MKVNSLKRKDCNFLATRSFAGHETNWPLLLHKLSLSTENQAKSSFFRFSSLSLSDGVDFQTLFFEPSCSYILGEIKL